MPYLLGIDAGNSKTHALVIDETGRVLGFGQGGPGNHQVCGLDMAVNEIGNVVRSALSEAGLSQTMVDFGCYCLAGADLPEDYSMLNKAMQNLSLTSRLIVKNDTMAALRAGLSRSWGVVVICGAGFNAAGRSADGKELLMPGLGALSGDWGGGGDISMEMIRLIVRAWDGRGKPTLLTRLILEYLRVPTIEALISRLYHEEIDQQRRLELVPLLFEAAEIGDETARELITRAGTEVGITARNLIRRIGLEQEDVEVVLGGSVFKGKGPLLLDTISKVVHEVAPQARLIKPRYEPVVGATLLALETMGKSIDLQIYKALEESLPASLLNIYASS